jgi:putative GTP pyrophosphokinase
MSNNFSATELERLENLLPAYEMGQHFFLAKLNQLSKDAMNLQNSNMIEHIKGRVKTPESIAGKLCKLGLEPTANNVSQFLKDVAGVRIICTFSRDIHSLVDTICSMPDWKVSEKEDYISNPKPSGYRSFHLLVEIPVHYSGKTMDIPIEVQIRTAAMDFWATMEHQVRYKYKEHVPQHLSDELVICADKIADLDQRMSLIHEIISLINQHIE